MRAGIMPSLQCPGEMMPGQFGPIRRERRSCRNSQVRTISSVGMPSVMQTMSSTSASAASMIASAANGGGTKITVALAPVLSAASCTVLKIGQPSCVVPPLPGVTPPITFVPYAAQAFAWKVPSRPVSPCTINRVRLSTKIAIIAFSKKTNDHFSSFLFSRPKLSRVLRRSYHFVGGIFHGFGNYNVESRLHPDFSSFLDVGAFQSQYDRQLKIGFPGRFHNSRCQRIHAQD